MVSFSQTMDQRIAIVCGHFIPDLGYIEVHLARTLSRLGYTVRVITSVKVPGYVRGLTFSTYSAGTVLTPAPAYTIQRLPTYFSAGQMVLSNGVKKAVKHFNPDLIFVIGLGKLFPEPVFDLAEYHERTYTLVGDNAHSFANNSLGTRFSKRFLKTPVYQKAIAHSERLFAYTPSAPKIIAKQVGAAATKAMNGKLVFTSLGFDGQVFYFDEDLRMRERKRLGLDGKFTWVCVSRYAANKDFSPFFNGLAELKMKGVDFKVVFAGVEGEGGEALSQTLYDQHLTTHAEVLPFLEHEELNALYNAADAAWYPMAAISNFEGLGAGLPILLPDEQNVSHILQNELRGDYYEKNQVPELMLQWTKSGPIDRRAQAEMALDLFGFRKVVGRILAEVLG